jgi:hypothetical protein
MGFEKQSISVSTCGVAINILKRKLEREIQWT